MGKLKKDQNYFAEFCLHRILLASVFSDNIYFIFEYFIYVTEHEQGRGTGGEREAGALLSREVLIPGP